LGVIALGVPENPLLIAGIVNGLNLGTDFIATVGDMAFNPWGREGL
jgi:hypothetical protein